MNCVELKAAPEKIRVLEFASGAVPQKKQRQNIFEAFFGRFTDHGLAVEAKNPSGNENLIKTTLYFPYWMISVKGRVVKKAFVKKIEQNMFSKFMMDAACLSDNPFVAPMGSGAWTVGKELKSGEILMRPELSAEDAKAIVQKEAMWLGLRKHRDKTNVEIVNAELVYCPFTVSYRLQQSGAELVYLADNASGKVSRALRSSLNGGIAPCFIVP